MIKCWEKRTEAVLPAFFRFRQVSFYIEIFENFYTKRLQVWKIYLSLHSRLRKTSNTAEHGAVVQLVRMRACHARGRGFEPHPHRLKALHESEGLFRIWHLPWLRNMEFRFLARFLSSRASARMAMQANLPPCRPVLTVLLSRILQKNLLNLSRCRKFALRFQVACRIKWWDSPIPDVERLVFLCGSSDSVVEGPSEVESHDSRVG